MRLEGLDAVPESEREKYGELALHVFMESPPEDPRVVREARNAGGARADVVAKLKR